MQNGGEKITNIKTYHCGFCTNDLHKMFKNMPHKKTNFPANAILFKHNNLWCLFDTGYSQRVLQNGWKSKLYNLLNPVTYNQNDSLAEQLKNDGIMPCDINTIIISHLHPDHIGGLKDFPNSNLIISKETYKTYKKQKPLDLIFNNLIPPNFEERVNIIEPNYDLFSDGSVILQDCSGHTKGQIGMLFTEHNTFYASDSLWRMQYIDKEFTAIAKYLQKDYKAYKKTIAKLKEMQEKKIKIILSHEG